MAIVEAYRCSGGYGSGEQHAGSGHAKRLGRCRRPDRTFAAQPPDRHFESAARQGKPWGWTISGESPSPEIPLTMRKLGKLTGPAKNRKFDDRLTPM